MENAVVVETYVFGILQGYAESVFLEYASPHLVSLTFLHLYAVSASGDAVGYNDIVIALHHPHSKTSIADDTFFNDVMVGA